MVAQREILDHLGELEDVAGLHLVAVVLEAAVPVLRHLGLTRRESLDDGVDQVLVDHSPQTDLLRILDGDVHRHVVVQDLDREVLAGLTQDLALLLFHDRACTVVRIHHLVANVEQASLP